MNYRSPACISANVCCFGQNESLYMPISVHILIGILSRHTIAWGSCCYRCYFQPPHYLKDRVARLWDHLPLLSLSLVLRVSPSTLGWTSPLEDWRALGCVLDLLAKCWYRTGGHLGVIKLLAFGIDFKIPQKELDYENKVGVNYLWMEEIFLSLLKCRGWFESFTFIKKIKCSKIKLYIAKKPTT